MALRGIFFELDVANRLMICYSRNRRRDSRARNDKERRIEICWFQQKRCLKRQRQDTTQ